MILWVQAPDKAFVAHFVRKGNSNVLLIHWIHFKVTQRKIHDITDLIAEVKAKL